MEPERRIEKVLRAYAKKRREDAGAPPELHPATRRLLQDEVARRQPKPAGSGDSFFAGLFASAGRKIAFAACVMAFILIGGMLIVPSLSGAKYRSQAGVAMSNLRQVDAALHQFALENGGRLPARLDELGPYLGRGGRGDQALVDPRSGQQFVYVGGENLPDSDPNAIRAYSAVDDRGRLVLFADGHIDMVTSSRFAALSNRTVALLAASGSPTRSQPADMIAASTPPAAAAQPALIEDKEKSDGGKLIADTAGSARLEDHQSESASTEKGQLRESVAPGTEVAAGTAAPPPGVMTVTGGAALGGAAGPTRPDLTVSSDSVTNTSSLIANNEARDQPARRISSGPAPTEVPRSESGTNFVAVANEPAPLTANADELKAGSKFSFNQANFNNNYEAGADAVSQQYVQTVEPAGAPLAVKKISGPVLVSFQVQQSDQNLRVVDQDGSVYSGYWRAAGAPDQNQKVAGSPAAAPPAATTGLPEADTRAYKDQQPAAQNYFFQVVGTNQSLKKIVVFNGNFIAVTSGVPLVQMNGLLKNSFDGGGAGGFQNKISNQSLQLLLSNSRISGTATIDNNKQIQINAVPTAAPR